MFRFKTANDTRWVLKLLRMVSIRLLMSLIGGSEIQGRPGSGNTKKLNIPLNKEILL